MPMVEERSTTLVMMPPREGRHLLALVRLHPLCPKRLSSVMPAECRWLRHGSLVVSELSIAPVCSYLCMEDGLCPERIMTHQRWPILRSSLSIALSVRKRHRSLAIINNRLEIQGRHRCPTQTAILSTNLSNCQTVVNQLLDWVRCCLEQGKPNRLAMTSSMSLISRAPALLALQSNYSLASE